MKEIEKVVAENITKLLKEKRITKLELAKIAGVSESTVGKWTLEKATPRMGAVQKISDYFNIPKAYILEEDSTTVYPHSFYYNHFDTPISAGLPDHVEAVTDVDKIEIPDSIMGKHAGQKDIFITRVNGESMNRIIPDCSLIAVKPIDIHQIKQGDIVVYSDNGDYSVKRFYKNEDQLIFRPDSNDDSFFDYITSTDNTNLKIHGKVVVYIVELD